MTFSLTTGSGLITKGANFGITKANFVPFSVGASTAGTCLVAIMGNGQDTSPSIPGADSGWTRLVSVSQGTATTLEIWVYPNNPGGILLFRTTSAAFNWYGAILEFFNVASISVLETSGTATATSGTTLSPITSGNVLRAGELGIAAWVQKLAVSSPVIFTPSAGWSLLADASIDDIFHLRADYIYSVGPIGAPVNPTLTSDHTTVSAAGAVIVLKPTTPTVDQTPYLAHDSQSIKLNTYDFGLMLGGKYLLEDGSGGYLLEDGSGLLLLDTYTPQLGDSVTLTDPAWSGRVVSVTNQDLTDKLTNYRRVSVTAINGTAAPGGTAPGDFSDVPAGGYFTLEDGSGKYLLEDGSGYYEQEGTSYAYRHLSVRTSQNQDGTTTTYGSLETFETGFAPGQTFLLTSANLGYAAQSFAITNVTTMFIGANPPTPVYLIEFGDAYQTLQLAGGGVLTKQGSQANIQAGVAMPAGTLGYAAATATQTGITTEVDLTGLSTTVQTVAGRRLKITGLLPQVDTSVAATWAGLRIYEDGNVIQDAKLELVATTDEYEMIAMAIRQPTAGAHTYKLTLRVTTGTGTLRVLWFATGPPFVLVEDIGT